MSDDDDDYNEYFDDDDLESAQTWATENGEYWASPKTASRITPGVYSLGHDYNRGVFFTSLEMKAEPLLRFIGHASDLVIQEIRDFWSRKELFKKHNVLFKRGIFLYGPPGTGKTCALKILTNDVVEAGGIAVKWPASADIFIGAMRLFRKLQPETPVVVLMEDLDAILEGENTSKILNILDGVESIDNIVYLATTNHAESFDANIIDRPSRFDKRFKIGYPGSKVREAYLRHLFGDNPITIDLKLWVSKTRNFSVAHLKELFIAVIILGNDFEVSVKRLRKMAEAIEPEEDRSKSIESSSIGFAGKQDDDD